MEDNDADFDRERRGDRKTTQRSTLYDDELQIIAGGILVSN